MIDGARAALPDSKTGPHAIWLGAPVLKRLAERPTLNDYVFTRQNEPVSVYQTNKVWKAVRERAGLPKLRLHDLRHGFASTALSSGEALHTVSGLLGHSDLKTTAGYARYAQAPVREAVERVAAHLEMILSGPQRGLCPEPPPVVAAFLAQRLSVHEYACKHGLSVSTLRQKVGAHNRLRREMLSGPEQT